MPPTKMRFDIAYPKQISEPEIRDLENAVNRLIRANLPVHTNIMNQEDAINAGAMALFGEKYGDEVRVVCVGDGVSMELCGGTHVKQTGSIGYFNIVSESAIAAGVRRLECVTGSAAEKFTQDIEDRLHRVGACLKAGFNDIENRVVQLLEEKKKLEAQIFDLKRNSSATRPLTIRTNSKPSTASNSSPRSSKTFRRKNSKPLSTRLRRKAKTTPSLLSSHPRKEKFRSLSASATTSKTACPPPI